MDLLFFNRMSLLPILILLLALLVGGCSGEKDNILVKIAYLGEIEEAPLLIAYEKDFFITEGVDVELVKLDYDEIIAGIANGDIQGVTVDYRVFEAVDKGAKIKIVAGLHAGCTQIIVNESTNINSLKDLEGKSIGVTKFGNGSMVVTSDLLEAQKIGGNVEWVVDEEENLRRLLEDHKIDAVSILEHPDPSKRTLDIGEKILYSSSNMENKVKSYMHFYESFIGLDENFIKDNRKTAFNTSIAWLKAALWLDENRNEAYKILLDKGYIEGDSDTMLKKAEHFMWMPGVKYAKDHVYIYSRQQRGQKILTTDRSDKDFLKKIYEPLIPQLNGR